MASGTNSEPPVAASGTRLRDQADYERPSGQPDRSATPAWRMGSVDQTKLHLLVRRGGMGWVKNEGERVDIALVGPDTDDGLIVQFLSMSYEETEAVEEHKRSAIDLVERMVELGRGRPWKYARYRTGTGANAYSHVRLFTQEGKNPLQRVEKAQRRPTGFRAEQLPSVEGIGPFGRFVVYNNGKYVGIHLIRGDLTIKGWIAELSPGHVAVSVTQPLKVCGMRTRLFDPYENGHLLDKDAVLNSYGLEVTVKLTNDIYEAASTMERRIGDIGPAMTAALRKALAAEGSLELGSEEWMHEVLDGLPGPPLDIDFVLFDSILRNWISRDSYGLRSIVEGSEESEEEGPRRRREKPMTDGAHLSVPPELWYRDTPITDAPVPVNDEWPTPCWHEGSVDTSNIHIIAVTAGDQDEEPEGLEVALVGPGPDDDVIVEFLPMAGVDREKIVKYKHQTTETIERHGNHESHPWRSVERNCSNIAEASGPIRLNLRLGLGPLQHMPYADTRPTGLLAKQPYRVEGVGAVGRFMIYHHEKYVGIHLWRDELLIKGRITWLSEDSVAVILRRPFRGGCVCRRISEPDENGGLVDEKGHLNGYGLEVVVELLNEMYEVAVAMENRLPDIMSALRTARESMSTEGARIGPSVDARLRAIWKAVPDPPFDFDIAFFKSGLHVWGKENPDYFKDGVWWV